MWNRTVTKHIVLLIIPWIFVNIYKHIQKLFTNITVDIFKYNSETKE